MFAGTGTGHVSEHSAVRSGPRNVPCDPDPGSTTVLPAPLREQTLLPGELIQVPARQVSQTKCQCYESKFWFIVKLSWK